MTVTNWIGQFLNSYPLDFGEVEPPFVFMTAVLRFRTSFEHAMFFERVPLFPSRWGFTRKSFFDPVEGYALETTCSLPKSGHN